MPLIRFSRCHLHTSLSYFVLALVFFLPTASAQTVYMPDQTALPVSGVGHDYIKMLNETVSPENGVVTIGFDMGTPPGRKLDFPFGITYNSGGALFFTQQQAYDLFRIGAVPPNTSPGVPSGWSYAIPWLTRSTIAFQTEPSNPRGGPPIPGPDGSTECEAAVDFEFTDLGQTQHGVALSEVFNIAGSAPGSGGIEVEPGTESSACGQSHFDEHMLGGDTAYKAQIIGADPYPVINDSPSVNAGDIYVAGPNGTGYYFSHNNCTPNLPYGTAPAYVEDSNGNRVTISNADGCSGMLSTQFTATDTVGRPVISAPPLGISGSINISGFAEPYKVTWSTQTFSGYTISLTAPSSGAGPLACSPSRQVTLPAGNVNAISSLTLPNGDSYQFSYDPVYGTLKQITYPSGAYVVYDWGLNPSGGYLAANPAGPYRSTDGIILNYYGPCPTYVDSVAVQHRYLYVDGQMTEQQDYTYSTTWPTGTYNGSTWKETRVTTHDLVTNQSFQTVYTYTEHILPAPPNTSTNVDVQIPYGLEQSILSYDLDGALLQTTVKNWIDQFALQCQFTTLNNNGPTSGTFYKYAPGNQVTNEMDYDYGVLPASSCGWAASNPAVTPTREKVIQYQAFSPSPISPMSSLAISSNPNVTLPLSTYAPVLLNRPSSSIVNDHGARIAETDYLYDQNAVASVSGLPSTANAQAHDETSYGASMIAPRGNVTKATRLCFQGSSACPSPSGNSVTGYTYDETGQLIMLLDPRQNTTTYVYTDSPPGGNAEGNSNAYLTTVTAPNVNNVAHVTSYQYDYPSGQLSLISDANRHATIYKYNDPFLRLTDIYNPPAQQNGGTQPHTSHTYIDGPDPRVISTDPINAVSQSVSDGLGRLKRVEETTANPVISMDDSTYNGLGEAASVAAPYFTTSDSTYGLTQYLFDALGRRRMQTNPDNTSRGWTYAGDVTTFTDENSNQWKQTSDSFGRLANVVEPDGAMTTYTYDALNNLLSVTQAGLSGDTSKNRQFVYDSLSRLTTSTNPESGTVNYIYDANGNLQTRTDARGIVSTYSYDALNRMTSQTFSGGVTSAPSVTFDYDIVPSGSTATCANCVGFLVDEFTGSRTQPLAETTIQSYDEMGRIESETQCVLQSCRAGGEAISYSYDLAGNLTSASNGVSGQPITITSSYDAADRLDSVKSSYSGDPANPGTFDTGHPDQLFSAVATTAYGPIGLVSPAYSVLTSGNNAASINRLLTYDKRQRVTSDQYTSPTAVRPATPSTAVVTIQAASGDADQSAQVTGTPIAGSGLVTVSGLEKSYQICQNSGTACHIVPDGGSVSLTIGSYTATSTYDTGVTTATVTQNLLNGLNASGSPVTATAPGLQNWQPGQSIQINIVSSTTGTASNFSMSATGVLNEGGCSKGCHTAPDFTLTPSGATLTGGHDATYTVYDMGSVSVAVNSAVATVPWSQASTAESIASSLVPQIQQAAGSTVTVTSSGNTVQLTSVATGPDSNFSVSLSDTFDTTDFTAASFAPAVTSQVAGVGPQQGGGTLYSYNIVKADGTTSGYDNVGNITDFNDSVMGQWHVGYDNLNRVQSAAVTSGIYNGLGLAWSIDAFGNRLSQMPTGHLPPQSTQGYTFNNAQNRPDQLLSQFDAAGNLGNDGSNGYLYDAAGRVCAIQQGGASGGSLIGYLYDAEGRRVAKGTLTSYSCDLSSNGFTPTAIFVLGPSGQQVSELDGAGNWKHTNVFAMGKLLATYDPTGLHFAFNDWVGTKRNQSSPTGAIENTCSSLPFGDSLVCSGSDATGMDTGLHYTGKERDSESGNDYFGARYYGSSMGRWMSPDWSAKQEPVPYSKLDNPQTLNLYSYVQNNPLSNFDDDGHATIEVKYNPLALGSNHSFIVITDRDGTQTVFRAGPSVSAGTGWITPATGGSASQSSTPTSSQSDSSNSSSPGAGPTANGNPYGQLYAQQESPTDPNGDNMSTISGSVTVLSNDLPASSYINGLQQFDTGLNSANIPYNPLSTNSNAYVTNALQSIGVPTPKAPVWAPGAGTNLNVTPAPPAPPPPPPPPCSVAGACSTPH